jgi:hypothetical protein
MSFLTGGEGARQPISGLCLPGLIKEGLILGVCHFKLVNPEGSHIYRLQCYVEFVWS